MRFVVVRTPLIRCTIDGSLVHDRLYDLIPVRIQMHRILNNRPDQANAQQLSYDIGKPHGAWLTSEEDRSLIG